MSPPSNGSRPTVRCLEDARWSCCSSGACCRGFAFGPVEDEVIDGLESRDVAAHWSPAAEAPWYERRHGEDGVEEVYFTHRDDHCVFLDERNLCAVHRLFGADAKPGFCREYPFHVVEEPGGYAVVVRADCEGLCQSFAHGDLVRDQVPEVMALPRARALRTFAPKQVVILPTAAVSVEDWLVLEQVVLGALAERPLPPGAAVAQLREQLHSLVNREAPPPDPVKYRLAIRAVFRALDLTMTRIAAQDPTGATQEARAFAKDMGTVIQRVVSRLDDPLPLLDDDATALLDVILRSQLMGKRFQAMGGVPFGLGLHLVDLTAAILGRPEVPDAKVGPADLDPLLPRWKRFTFNRTILGVLRLARPALGDMFLHANG